MNAKQDWFEDLHMHKLLKAEKAWENDIRGDLSLFRKRHRYQGGEGNVEFRIGLVSKDGIFQYCLEWEKGNFYTETKEGRETDLLLKQKGLFHSPDLNLVVGEADRILDEGPLKK